MAAGITARLTQPSPIKEKFKTKGIFDILSIACLLGTVLLLWNMKHVQEFSFSLQHQPYYFPFLAALIAGLLVFLSQSRVMGRLMDNPFFRYTAKISFGLYIWHYIVIMAFFFYWDRNYYIMGMRDWRPWLLISIVMIAVSYIVATLSYYFLEKPFMDKVHRKIAEPKPEFKFRKRIRIKPVISAAILSLIALAFLYPLIWLFDASLRPPLEALQVPPVMFQKPLLESVRTYTRESYLISFSKVNAGRFLLNSAVITLTTVALTLVVSSLCAYALVFIRFPGKQFFFITAITTMMVPITPLIIPFYFVIKSLHLLNNWLGLILPSAVSGLGVFLLRQYFIKIPLAVIESARMDGANHLQIWWHMILPMARPALAALAVIQFRLVWNDFLVPTMVLRDEHLFTLPIEVAFINNPPGNPWAQLSMAVITVIIPLALFLRFHRNFIEGLPGGQKS
jgi:ABC-type glycerol-3-phosphate transport system permease component